MSNYEPACRADASSGRAVDDAQCASRQQLPSLSSLFGPPPQVRPLNSPLSDRTGSYACPSPLDRSHGLTPTLERPHNPSSYFPPPAPASLAQPASPRESRPDDRLPLSTPARTFSIQLSPPRAREPDYRRPPSSPGFGTARRWSRYQYSDAGEYSFGSRESLSYQGITERLPRLSTQAHVEDSAAAYGEQLSPGTTARNPPTTPVASAASEAAPMKDGLGPKIWTGTHFLPRFVKAADVPGEGLCYFYDDGSHCKTVIDGEAVNAHWGVTKAGKPRKRLAIACVTCREKKIKCDPDYPRCVQCEKFGRVCKFKNAPRGGHNPSASTPPADSDETRRLSTASRPHHEHRRPSSKSSESVSPQTVARSWSPDYTGSRKRIRLGYEHFTPVLGPRSPMIHPADASRLSPTWSKPERRSQPELPRIHEDVLSRAWQTDPYVSDPQSVNNIITSFFVYADAVGFRFLPENTFQTWVQTAHKKSPEDLMLVYSALALGILLSCGTTSIAHEYLQVARYATEHAPQCLQLVQSRVLLALSYSSVLRLADAGEMASAAASAAVRLQLNLELDESLDKDLAVFPWGLTRAGYAESRRRTFWSCFMLERLSGHYHTHVNTISLEDVFVRLPASVKSFEGQVEGTNPVFDAGLLSPSPLPEAGTGTMASYLIYSVALFGRVMTEAYRASHQARYPDAVRSQFRHNVLSCLERWRASLPQQLVFSAANLDTIAQEDKGAFMLMHLLHHLTAVKLHRHVHAGLNTASLRALYGPEAREHAEALLGAVCTVAKDGSLGRSTPPTPFSSYAIVEAVDVLSAEGMLVDLPQLIDALAVARSVLEILSTTWDNVKAHKATVDRRLDVLAALRDDPDAAAAASVGAAEGVRVFVREGLPGKDLPAGGCWRIPHPLEDDFPVGMDCVYHGATPVSP